MKKLVIKKETIAKLNSNEMMTVAGGNSPQSDGGCSITVYCGSRIDCVSPSVIETSQLVAPC